MGGKLQPFFSENFTSNLDEIRAFMESKGSLTFERIMDRLFDDIIPLLCRFPRSGRRFLSFEPGSLEAETFLRRLRKLLKKGDELREFVVDEFILLYLIRKKHVVFLAIKHHRQLSFDFRQLWP